jgi:hypothetical protein
MSEQNYASLEASKRLVAAGIVLETEAGWRKKRDKTGYYLSRKALYHRTSDAPAPSMAEVWRELPETALQPCRDTTTGYCHEYLSLQKDGDLTVAGYGEYSEIGRNSNPTDALIDLLIWVKKEARDE